ncbi:hypothetical protein PVT67_08260 [Gallaecimonas kandeliae]|uniref:hypothetical protein n=1 Tax=Gallaecimonas kandeliae TaxID=3029055 RepID=UPI00264814F7|nr:hypothetical protein [Gallaecimonas kandeliae]WKE67216.1 hypothetical protein PVT67_08260 [Gallaecimonas kandeliae]
MSRITVLGILALATLSACKSISGANVTNYTAEHDLESTKPAACTNISGLSSQQNPADIFSGVKKCLAEGKYDKAAKLYFAAISYGSFDTKRVSDQTAHQAISVLRMNVLGSQPQDALNKLQSKLKSLSSDNTSLCGSLTKLGAPTYYPSYMIQHGMGAFSGQVAKNDLVENFDGKKAWQETLATIAHCQ